MRIGYARVSTDDQTLDLQRDALKRARCREIYEEQASGKTTGRPQLDGCIKSLREGDTLVVWRLDRLGRNLADLVRLIADLEQRKVNFESLTEQIETRSPAGRLVFHVFAALADNAEGAIMQSHSAEVSLWPAFQSRLTPHYPGSNSEAMSASGALNRPRCKPRGNTASKASNFSEGSIRR